MATNGNINHDQYATPAQTTGAPAGADASNNNLPKDEVGWYFVEQYYTTMSKSPDRLHLFYGKKAQFVGGREAEVVNVSFGRHAIQERIKGMDFQDCKVRISNVDTQGSEENILISVIGEMANKDGEPKKFVQTFVLAQQPSGYFVLNDMLRYINEDVEDEEVPADESAARVEMPGAAEPQAKTETAAEEATQEEQAPLNPDAVAEKLEVVQEQEAPASTEAETQAQPDVEEAAAEVPEPATEDKQTQPDAEKAVEQIAAEEVQAPEEPKDPAPTPAAPAVPPVQAEKPKEPPKPMSWASRLAAVAGAARPVAPVPKAATPPAANQPRAPARAAPAQQAQQPQQPQESSPASAAAKDQASEWQTAETKRQSRAPSAAQPEREGTMAYVKYVTEKVSDGELETTLKGFGELAYFDINRTKNCAFVEYKTAAGYKAAIAASPIVVNGESIVVEPRRPKANAYGGANYSSGRGGRGGRLEGGRGGFAGRGRGAPRGRGPSSAA